MPMFRTFALSEYTYFQKITNNCPMSRHHRFYSVSIPFPGHFSKADRLPPVYFHSLVPDILPVPTEELARLFDSATGRLVVVLLDKRFAFWGHLVSIRKQEDAGITTLIVQNTSQRDLFLSVSMLERMDGSPSYAGTLVYSHTNEHSILCRKGNAYYFERQPSRRYPV